MSAQEVGIDACRTDVNRALAREQRFFRNVLLGKKHTKDARIGSVYYAVGDVPYIKTDTNTWITLLPNYAPWNDSNMELNAETPARRGIFETRGVLTSDLVPALTQSVRALQCRADIVCATAMASLDIKGVDPTNLFIEVPGCIDTDPGRISFPGCQLVAADEKVAVGYDIFKYCEGAAKNLVAYEADNVRMLTEYDAANRSLLQFAGFFDAFLGDWEAPLTGTLRQATGLLKAFSRIPCFISSCDSAPTE